MQGAHTPVIGTGTAVASRAIVMLTKVGERVRMFLVWTYEWMLCPEAPRSSAAGVPRSRVCQIEFVTIFCFPIFYLTPTVPSSRVPFISL